MPHQTEPSFTRYLASKKTVDDRALNQRVFDTLAGRVRGRERADALKVLELGAGIGTMIERLADWGLFDHNTVVSAIDHNSQAIQAAQQRLSSLPLTLELEAVDVFEFIQREQGRRRWDLVVAHAFLDLVDAPKLLSMLRGLLIPGALGYFTINFDGVTVFEPEIDPDLDALIERLYHQTMDRRVVSGMRSGHSQTGRRLFKYFSTAGFEVIDAGSSDWVVFPHAGGYPHDEAFFLHFIIDTIQTALRESPELDPSQLAGWAEQRHQQIEQGQLTYVAHQLDFLTATVS